MFSFHKPKVYRSPTGCCICKAKSSSSRFTDSKKYELDFIECFQLTTPRKGEICNACVLLVKRFKRLPPGMNRHWGHVVDARVGPGLKSMTKFKKRKEDQKVVTEKKVTPAENGQKLSMPERFCKIFKKTKKKKIETMKNENSATSDESSPNSPSSSLSETESNADVKPISVTKLKRKNFQPCKNRTARDLNVIDTQLWKKRKTCCGFMHESTMFSAVIVDLATYKPCKEHTKKSPVAELERELDNVSTEDLLIKLTDEQIQENYENASLSGVNKINKMSDLFPATPQPNQIVLKKYQLYSKRGLVDNTTIKTDTIAQPPTSYMFEPPAVETNGRRLMESRRNPLKVKPLEFRPKDLLRTDKMSLKAKINGAEGVIGDNSSDSGYEEAHEAQNLKNGGKTVILANGVTVHCNDPQNFLLATTLAGVPIMPAPFQKPITSEPTSVIRLQSSSSNTYSHPVVTRRSNNSNQNLLIIHTDHHQKQKQDASSCTSTSTSEVISLATNEQLPSSPTMLSPPIPIHASSIN